MSRIFCINCNKYVEYYTTAEDVEVVTPKGKMKCRQLSAHCFKCWKEIYVPKINDENCKLREYAYKNFIDNKVKNNS